MKLFLFKIISKEILNFIWKFQISFVSLLNNYFTNKKHTTMQTRTIIKSIKKIIGNYGGFSIKEVEGVESICVNNMGNLVALAEYFDNTGIEANVYEPSSFSSDEIDSYELTYEELSKDILEEILFLAEMYEAEQQKTLKRISTF